MPRELVTVLGKASEDYIRRQLGEDSFRPVMCMLFLYRIMDQVLLLLKIRVGNSLEFQWLGLSAFTAKGAGSMPGRVTKIPQATRRGQKTQKTTQKRKKGQLSQ